MRLLSKIALGLTAAGFALTLDLGATLRTGDWTPNTAFAKHHHKRHHKHRKHHRARHRHKKHKQTEM